MEPFDGTQDPHTHLQALYVHLEETTDLATNCFLEHCREWLCTGELATSFASQFAANKMKRMEVADLFDIKQTKGETLKSYLAGFNNATVKVNNPDQKFFVKAFQKGLRVGATQSHSENPSPWRRLEPEQRNCRSLGEEIEWLIQEGYLSQYVRKGSEKAPTRPRAARRAERDEAPRENRRRPERDEKQKERSKSPREGTLGIGVGRGGIKMERNRKRKASDILVVQQEDDTIPTLVISFSERDMRYDLPRHDEPMVISMVVVEYKVERALVDQGSLVNILYWSTYMKMGLKPIDMEPCAGKLYGFAGEQVEIRGAVELETMFGEGNHA
ncbi:hypothetical protein CR513_49654, partial [Mucuna pruriens]